MKKSLFFLTTLLAASCALCFTGCNDKGKTGDNANDIQTKITDKTSDDTCPDCEERGMPKVRFEFRDGKPACKDGESDGIEPPHGHRKTHPHPPKHPRPAPPEDGGQDKSEN